MPLKMVLKKDLDENTGKKEMTKSAEASTQEKDV
jgi:hypothetical protein